ncbi:ABC transporter substrate-binding protein [Solibacillus sp. R5-41]|uniref:ABC transporter substrate-binding protein n=1 Tax=Solibacillus sp. R5-41 TaxID=2048654 RepID=UPI000C127576|nr:ABC transporter substrate-binding protein [Solibacillus sp. R5-41]ATP40431.1 ABC transporter substrate-binding protein [Solibacillus sp. R5-41]
MWKWLSIIGMSLLLVGCQQDAKTEDSDLTKVQVVLDWTPNTNHTGLYVAQEKGYFEEAGLDVEIIQPGDAGADQLVATGKAQFGISAQESVTQARLQGVPIVSIAAIIQHNTSGFASLKETGIQTPKDFEGKTYGGWGSPVEQAIIKTVMGMEDGDVEKVDIVNAGSADFFNMMKQDIDFAWIYYGWTGIEAELREQAIDMLYLTDYAKELDYYTPVIITNEKYIDEEEETVRAFMQAVSKGYELAINEPEEAASMLLKAVPELDEELVVNSAIWLSKQYQAEASQWGIQSLDVWENYANWMFENKLIEKELDAEKAFTNQFLPEE